MSLTARLAAGVLATVAVIVAAVLLPPGGADRGPPLTGWMKNFTPLEAPAPAPEMAFWDADSKPRHLADFRGKVVVLNFWATWCGPCIREMPTLVRLQARLGTEDFAVLALSEDRRGWPVIRPFLDKHGLEGLVAYHDQGGRAARALKVTGLPTTVVFDRAGRELGHLAGIAEWDADEVVALLRYYAGT